MNNFQDVWETLPIPGEYDAMDACDNELWRDVCERAYDAGRRSMVDGCMTGEVVEVGADDEGHPRVIVYGTRESLGNGRACLYHRVALVVLDE